MTLTLYIGNKRYSSWSMRPWVLLKALEVPFEEKLQIFKAAPSQPQFISFSPTAKVPCLYDSQQKDVAIWDSLAIAEYIAEQHPAAWPKDAVARAFARSAAAEMHSGFSAIRDECSMNVALRIEIAEPSDALKKDLARFTALFNDGLKRFGGPWLAGSSFSVADAFYAPVASRCKTFGLKLEGPAQEYVDRLYEHPAVQDWIKQGCAETERDPYHEMDCIRGRKVLQDFGSN